MAAGVFRTPAALTRLDRSTVRGQGKINFLVLKAWGWA